MQIQGSRFQSTEPPADGRLDDDRKPAPMSRPCSSAHQVLLKFWNWREVLLGRTSRFRAVFLSIALGGLLVGSIWAALALGIDWTELQFRGLLLCLLLLAPSLWLNAVELQLCARAAGGRIGFSPALSTSSWSTIANLLPLPAGVLIRGSALTRSGASVARSGTILVVAGLLWLAIAVAVAASVVPRSGTSMILLVCALIALIPIILSIVKLGGAAVAAGFVAVRTALLALTIGRIYFCFMTLNHPTTIHESSAYAAASVVGAIVGIAPAGAGIAEGVGAALATLMERSAAAAFLALSMNRLIGLGGAALLSVYYMFRRHSGGLQMEAQ